MSNIESDGGRGRTREPARREVDNEAADFAELEQALTHDSDDDDGGAGTGVDGLDALGVDLDGLDNPTQGDRRRKPAANQGGGQDDLEPLPYEELRRRERQKGGALREAREAQRAADARVAAVENKFERLVGIIQGRGGFGAATEQEAPIDIKKEPLRALAAMAAKIERYEAHETERATNDERTRTQAAQVQTAMAETRRAEAEFKQIVPDYDHAADHYIKTRMRMATAQGMTAQQAQQNVFRELLQTGMIAKQLGRNPAELIYEAARAAGYKRGQRPDPRANGGRGNGQGGQQRRTAPVSGFDDADFEDDYESEGAQQLDRIERGRRSGRSFGAGERGGGGGRGDVPNLLDLDGEDFDKAADKFIRRMRGRGGR